VRVALQTSAGVAANECGAYAEFGQQRRQIMSVKREHVDATEAYERYAVSLNQISGIHRISLSLENKGDKLYTFGAMQCHESCVLHCTPPWPHWFSAATAL